MTAYRAFLDTLVRFHPGDILTIDDIRPEVDAAQMTNHEKGQVFKDACRAGLLVATGRVVPSTHPPAKSRLIQRYRRTDVEIPRAA